MAQNIDPIGAFQNQPENINFLSSHRFRVMIHRTPNLQYFVQEANLPGMVMGTAVHPSGFTNIPYPGDKITWEPFTMTFPVDENMENYKEIANWIVALGFPREHSQFAKIKVGAFGDRSDIALLILDSNQNVRHSVLFRDAFPTAISGLQFDTKTQETPIPLATVTFAYTYFEFDEVNQIANG